MQAAWVRALSTEFPTLAFHASINNSFGKGSLIQILRQFSSLHSDRKQISVGLIGYPNTGKSSIINTLRSKKVCTVAPIAGETKVWQYVTLMKRIYLIDCMYLALPPASRITNRIIGPGIVPPNNNDTDESLLLRGSIRVENVEYPAQYIDAVLARVQQKHVQRTYQLKPYNDSIEFLEQLARKYGRMLKGGEPDMDGCAKIVINDWIRGKLPWFTPPPMPEGMAEKGVAGREGRLGEMGKKRKRDEAGNDVAADAGGAEAQAEGDAGSEAQDSDEDDEFEGFGEGGMEIDVEDEDGNGEEADDSGDDDAKTLVAEEDDSEDEVEEEVHAISQALAKARKSAKKA